MAAFSTTGLAVISATEFTTGDVAFAALAGFGIGVETETGIVAGARAGDGAGAVCEVVGGVVLEGAVDTAAGIGVETETGVEVEAEAGAVGRTNVAAVLVVGAVVSIATACSFCSPDADGVTDATSLFDSGMSSLLVLSGTSIFFGGPGASGFRNRAGTPVAA